jgi:hypothetical protein
MNTLPFMNVSESLHDLPGDMSDHGHTHRTTLFHNLVQTASIHEFQRHGDAPLLEGGTDEGDDVRGRTGVESMN